MNMNIWNKLNWKVVYLRIFVVSVLLIFLFFVLSWYVYLCSEFRVVMSIMISA